MATGVAIDALTEDNIPVPFLREPFESHTSTVAELRWRLLCRGESSYKGLHSLCCMR